MATTDVAPSAARTPGAAVGSSSAYVLGARPTARSLVFERSVSASGVLAPTALRTADGSECFGPAGRDSVPPSKRRRKVRIRDLLAQYAGHWISVGPVALCNGSASRPLAMVETVLERFDDAEAHYLEAIRAHEEIGAHLLVARTQLSYARMLVARDGTDDRARASVVLESAAKTAAELGLKRIAAEADSLAQEIRRDHPVR